MARIIDSSIESYPVSKLYSIWKMAIVGSVLGVIYWGLATIIMKYSDSIDTAGGVATIVVATLGIIIMLSLRMTRPLLVALASAIALLGLNRLTDGLVWYEIVGWTILLYGLAYVLFSWISRYARLVPVLIVVITIISIVRISLTL